MQKVLLIGNGFDIAHNAPTSFLDFSEYLIKEKLIPELKKYISNKDKSIYFKSTIINKAHNTVFPENDFSGSVKWNLFGVFEFNKEKQYEMLNRKTDYWLNHLSNNLLLSLFNEKLKYWFSVEDTFYRHLKIIYNKIQSNNYEVENLTPTLDKLNDDFNEIKNLLKEYLLTISIEKKTSIEMFFEKFKKGNDFLNGELHIINFNYTETIKKYNLPKKAIHYYYPIHGNLNEKIIFGYGNDKDNVYQEIKDLGDDKFLEHFKTHKYLLNSTYQDIHSNLLLTKDAFEVHVIGHSLGLTDKTLLQEIFNSPNCKKIHLYKRADKYDYNLNNKEQVLIQKEFTKLTMAASRIINDEMTRIKIVNYDLSQFFPYVNE
jgi:hypothetical protein